MPALRSASRLAEHAVGGDGDVGQIAGMRAGGIVDPVLLPAGFQCGPALAKSGGSQRPTAWTWIPWIPCGRPAASIRKVTPPAVSQVRTLPMVCPAALTSAIGGPPCGSSVTQPASGAAPAATKARLTKIIGRM